MAMGAPKARRATLDNKVKSNIVGAAQRAQRAELLQKSGAAREEEAAFVFSKFDTSNSGKLGVEELRLCFEDLGFSNGRQNKTDEEMRKWVQREIKRGDTSGSGQLSYVDFLDYYQKFVVGHRRNFEETFELGTQIGRGAFGNVYRAKKIGGVQAGVPLGTQVAVKMVQKEAGVQMELLHNEITIWKTLSHPNLVLLLDVFEDDHQLCLVTELMRGGDLFKHLSKASTFTEGEAARLARQIVSAVAHLHEHGVVHCDLKPSNVLVADVGDDAASREQMTVKIADFGLSQSLMEGHSSGKKLTEVCGTPDYYAPELVELAQGKATMLEALEGSSGALQAKLEEEGKGYGPPLDCWAVGCILYELLAGQPPYQAQDEEVLFYKITENQMEFPKGVFDSISPQAIDLIRELTQTDPAQRLSCEAALGHEWLQEGAHANAAPLPEEVQVQRRKSLHARSLGSLDGAHAAAAAAAAAMVAEEEEEEEKLRQVTEEERPLQMYS